MDAEQTQTALSRSENGKKAKGKKKKSGKKMNAWSFTLLYVAIAIIIFIVGAMVGYGVLGERPPLEIFDFDTWGHMYDLIFG